MISLMTNAQREGDGATRLWTLSACASDMQEKALLKRHAVDESNHAMWYLALLDLVFPGSVEETFHAELRTLSPAYSMSRDVFVVEGFRNCCTWPTDRNDEAEPSSVHNGTRY
jgi:hypothetical protein